MKVLIIYEEIEENKTNITMTVIDITLELYNYYKLAHDNYIDISNPYIDIDERKNSHENDKYNATLNIALVITNANENEQKLHYPENIKDVDYLIRCGSINS